METKFVAFELDGIIHINIPQLPAGAAPALADTIIEAVRAIAQRPRAPKNHLRKYKTPTLKTQLHEH